VKSIKGNFALFSGVTITNIPLSCGPGDHLYKQCSPIKSWGKEYILTPFMYQSDGYIFRIIASEDNTTLTIPAESKSIILNSGNYYEEDVTDTRAIYVYADKPLSVVQYMKGADCNGYIGNIDSLNIYEGDPAMLILNSNNQMLKEAVFKSATTNYIDSLEFINIITKTINCDSIVLDGKKINKNSFAQVPFMNSYSYALLQIDTGIHIIRSDSGFIAYAYGVGVWESYVYSLGMGMTCVNPIIAYITPSRIKCSRDSIQFKLGIRNYESGISYQWYKNEVEINDATSSMYIKSILMQSDEGTYSCVVNNDCGTTSANTILTFASGPSLKDTIISLTKNAGDSLTVSIIPGGTEPFTYQWMKSEDGSWRSEAGETNSTFSIQHLKLSDSGTYSCVINNVCGSITSEIFTLAVQEGDNTTQVQSSKFKVECYPNPANLLLVVRYSLLEKSKVNLSFYDLSGRKVIMLSDEDKRKGDYKIEIDAEKLNNGVYFCRIVAGNEAVTRKIVIVH
jgi:hypothetical protein